MKFFFSVCGLAAGLQVRSPANVRMGEEIGALLSEGISKDPVGFNKSFQSATSNFPVVSNDAVEAVARNHVQSSAFLEMKHVDYDSCPLGWSSAGDLCVAPDGFYGCSRRFNRRVLNASLKQKFAEKNSELTHVFHKQKAGENGYQLLSQHYGFGLKQAFELQDSERVIVLEEDIQVR